MSDRRLLACFALSVSTGAFLIGMPIKWIALYHFGHLRDIPLWFTAALGWPMLFAGLAMIASYVWVLRIDNAERKERETAERNRVVRECTLREYSHYPEPLNEGCYLDAPRVIDNEVA